MLPRVVLARYSLLLGAATNSSLGAAEAALAVKNPPANAGDAREVGSIPGSGRSPGVGYGNPLLYSCPDNPIDRGGWRATVCRVAKSQTRLKQFSMHVLSLQWQWAPDFLALPSLD